MSWLDFLIVGVISLSALISLIRGFVKESISLLSWIAAGIVAFRYFSAMAELLEPYLADPTIRSMAAFAVLFISTLIIGAIINFIMSQLVSKTGLSGTDKALGVVFGGARGVLIVTMVVLLASLPPCQRHSGGRIRQWLVFFNNWRNGLKELSRLMLLRVSVFNHAAVA